MLVLDSKVVIARGGQPRPPITSFLTKSGSIVSEAVKGTFRARGSQLHK